MSRRKRQIGKQERTRFIREPKQRELIDIMARRYRREMINRGIIPDPSKRAARYKFIWFYGSLCGKVYADNRSLARSLIKQELGIKKKNRLPIEVEITREPNEDSDEDSATGSEEDSDCDNRRSQTCAVV